MLSHSQAKSVCVCVFSAPLCAAVTVISHQSEAAEPHIDIPHCLPVYLSGKNRYVKRQALSPSFPTHSLSELVGKKERSGLVCVSSDEKESACGKGSDILLFRKTRQERR